MHNLRVLIQSLKCGVIGYSEENTNSATHPYESGSGMNRHMHEEIMLMLSQKQA